jgi:hypothetical protein
VILNGRVASGRGETTAHIGKNAEVVRSALGEGIVAGSLNIVLKRPVLFVNETAIAIPFNKGRPRLDWPGRLHGVAVWVNRWQGSPLHIVELLAPVHLRRHLHLADGDKVQIEVRKQDVARLTNAGRLTWLLFWWGRQNWTYTNENYHACAERWCKSYGASQIHTDKNCRDLALALSKAAVKRIPGARRSKTAL